METRLIAAEEEIAHLSRAVDDLSDVVARQQDDLSALRRQIERLVAREAERLLDGDSSPPLADQRPPHW